MSNVTEVPQAESLIDMETLLTEIFVIVDDWYQDAGRRYLQGKRGVKPTFSDSELLTLLLAMDILAYESERRFYKD